MNRDLPPNSCNDFFCTILTTVQKENFIANMWIVQANLRNSENTDCTDKMYIVQKSTVSSTLLGVNNQTLNLMHLFERKIFFPHKLSVEN